MGSLCWEGRMQIIAESSQITTDTLLQAEPLRIVVQPYPKTGLAPYLAMLCP